MREQVREQPQHGLAVFQHVGHARRRADIILQHIEIIGVNAYNVDAGNMHMHPSGRLYPRHFGPETRVAQNKVFGNDPGLHAFTRSIHVGEKRVQRQHPLLQPCRQPQPFRPLNQAGHHIKRYQPLRALFVAIDGECNADPAKKRLRLHAAVGQLLFGNAGKPRTERRVNGARQAISAVHFIKNAGPPDANAKPYLISA